ncbi:glycosyltransferase family 2 protein [Paenibacillus hexagrammi]|uniref:Glycosyltransferase n=1 Tax=Paenibacillus hexagrammi TaxID=2908839 RepID=A0ABY3SQK0_9BACL|nr:glycosyltransferase family 2 protein [Paenibacillus sp. YPD9-1]UJF36337.1 glycosyltransferase [Paenibacillus sp. YPD9-1]
MKNGQPAFSEADRLPFMDYVCMDMKYQLESKWTWQHVSSVKWHSPVIRTPSWERAQEQWSLIHPILAAHSNMEALANNPEQPCISISIVICTYNNAEYLPWAIRSVLIQDCFHWKLLIVDDASTDSTSRVLDSYRNHPSITIISNESNQGKSNCLNKAIQIASNDWLLELDADDWLPPDCIRKLIHVIRAASAETALLHGDHYDWLERPRKQLLFRGLRKGTPHIQRKTLIQQAAPVIPRCYRISALRQIGGWNTESLFDGRLYEDLEIILRLTKDNEEVYIPSALYHRRNRPSSITKLNAAKYAQWAQWAEPNIEKK